MRKARLKWILICVFLQIFSGGALSADALQNEVDRLEGLHHSKKIDDSDLQRLAEIYFLTSRCPDVKKLLSHRPSPLACVCGAGCPNQTDLERLSVFKKLVDRGENWNSVKTKLLWSRVAQMPEARYWALKSLRANPSSFRFGRLKAMRAELEKSLESLEVQQ